MTITKINMFSVKSNNYNYQQSTPRVAYKNQLDSVSFSRNNALMANTISFGAEQRFRTKLSPEKAEMILTKLSNSTSGLRGEYGGPIFNAETTSLITESVAAKLIADKASNTVLVGGDMRHASKITVPQIAKQMKNNGFTVLYSEQPVPTPALALAAKRFKVGVAFLNTASHNNWRDGGYNLLTNKGAVADPHFTKPLIEFGVNIAKGRKVKTQTGEVGQIIKYDAYPLYKDYLDTKKINGQNIIDFKAIKDAGVEIFYDDLGGTGSYYLPRLLEDHGIEIKKSLRTHTEGPEPNAKNLKALSDEVKSYKSKSGLKIGLSNDGDSDRFGIVDEKGNFIPANDVLLLMVYHLNKHKGYKKGTVLRSVATSSQVDLLAKQKGLNVIVTPVGFKYIGEKMIDLAEKSRKNPQLTPILGGEESGGLTIGGHIPEKDGFVATLAIAELVAKEGKPVGQILKEIKASLGKKVQNGCTNYSTPDKEQFIGEFRKMYNEALDGKRKEVFGMPIDVNKTKAEFATVSKFKKGGDGVKLYFQNGSSVLVRLSGTEEKARVYKEIYSATPKEAAATSAAIDAGVAKIAQYCNAKAL